MNGRSTSGRAGFGPRERQRAQAGALPAHQDQGLHQRCGNSRAVVVLVDVAQRPARRRSAARFPRRRSRPRAAPRGRGSCARRSPAGWPSARASDAQSSSANSGHSVTRIAASAPSSASSAESQSSTLGSSSLRGALGDGVVAAHRSRPRRGAATPSTRLDRLPHVVGVRLEREPEERDLLADQRAQVLLELLHHAPLLQLVDLDHRGQELEVVAGVPGELLEGAERPWESSEPP